MALKLADMQARLKRLHDLSCGLAREAHLWEEGMDPLLRAERKAYLDGIYAAFSGIEAARVALGQAVFRIEEETRLRNDASGPGSVKVE